MKQLKVIKLIKNNNIQQISNREYQQLTEPLHEDCTRSEGVRQRVKTTQGTRLLLFSRCYHYYAVVRRYISLC